MSSVALPEGRTAAKIVFAFALGCVFAYVIRDHVLSDSVDSCNEELLLLKSLSQQQLQPSFQQKKRDLVQDAKSSRFVVEEDKKKQDCEMGFWQSRYNKEVVEGKRPQMDNGLYVRYYTEYMDLPYSFFEGKKLLDIGCGPRGSLLWAKHATARICVDPLVMDYGRLGIENHDMVYVEGGTESMPFPDNSIDVITSINNLDHVTDLDAGISEISRVLSHGGSFLLIVEVHPFPTVCEPLSIPWNLSQKFEGFKVVLERHHESSNWPGDLSGGTGDFCNLGKAGYGTISAKLCPRFDHSNKEDRDGWLVLHLKKL